MSPRFFRLGLALFLVMSGTFAAKLLQLGPDLDRVRAGFGGLTAMLSGSDAASPAASPTPAVENVGASAASDRAAIEAAKVLEASAHLQVPTAEQDGTLVVAIRRELGQRGYATGNVTAQVVDLEARAAIMAFEADHGMRLTGEANQALLHHLLLGPPQGEASAAAPPAAHAEEVIRSVQEKLKRSGRPDLPVDGRLNHATVDSIRAFERSQGMPETGRISGGLVARLQGVARDEPR